MLNPRRTQRRNSTANAQTLVGKVLTERGSARRSRIRSAFSRITEMLLNIHSGGAESDIRSIIVSQGEESERDVARTTMNAIARTAHPINRRLFKAS